MRYVAGTTLGALSKKVGPLPVPVVRALVWDIGSALSFAHAHGVLHRDVKPANVMMGRDGSVVVTDFGIAKQVEGQGLTLTGQMLGTPAYMSPEQCRSRDLSPAADQYSLGAMAFELLAGRTPFVGASAADLVAQQLTEAAPQLSKLRSDCPKELASAVMRMLAKEPRQRFASVDDALAAMRATPVVSTDPIRLQVRQWVEKAGQAPGVANTPLSPILRPPARPPLAPTEVLARREPRDLSRWKYPAIGAAVVVPAMAAILLLSRPSTREAPLTDTVRPNAQTLAQLSPPLPPTRVDSGTLVVSRLPSGAVLYVDGVRASGNSVVVEVGQHSVRLEVPGVPARDTLVQVTANATTSFELRIDPPQPPAIPRGTLVVRQRPADGTIRIDGRRVSGSRFVLDAGRHAVSLEAPGFFLDTVVQVVAGRTEALAFAATAPSPPPAPPRGRGALMVRVRPFAKIFVDGRLAAEDELLVTSLPEGQHRLRFEKAGFATLDTSIVIAAGDTVKRLFTLQPRTP
jgi:hypothetical protein